MKKKKNGGNTYVVSSGNDYYDDCPVCQAMKKVEEEGRVLSESEITEAFEKSKAVGGIVGFPSADEEKPNN